MNSGIARTITIIVGIFVLINQAGSAMKGLAKIAAGGIQLLFSLVVIVAIVTFIKASSSSILGSKTKKEKGGNSNE